MAARAYSGKKPKNLKHTLRVFLSYLGRHKKMLAVVAVLVTISAGANLLGTYMIRPVVNGLADGDVHTLLCGVLITALIFGCGALAAYGYTQTMVKAAQQVVFDIRRDLFEHVQTLPLQFFDSRRHGDIMSLFTNDIDTMADALNNSFAMVIQSFIQIVGTLTLLYILNWRLSLIVTVCYGIMFWYIKFSGKRSKGYYTDNYLSIKHFPGMENINYTNFQIYPYIFENYPGTYDIKRQFTIESINKEVANLLSLAEGSPAIHIISQIYTEDGSQVEYSNIWVSAHFFKFQISKDFSL